MPTKLSFEQAKSRFGTDKDAMAYCILVESYEKHLEKDQTDVFLNADTINDMLNILSLRQLRHLASLVSVLKEKKISSYYDAMYHNYYMGEAFSKWFTDNVYGGKNERLRLCRGVSDELINKIKKIEQEKISAQKYKKDVIDKYKSRLKNFDGNSMEYRQWLILLYTDSGIPFIEKTYDVIKLLKRLSIEYLEKLKDEVKRRKKETAYTISGIRHYEPYFYFLANNSVFDINDIHINDSDAAQKLSKQEDKMFSELKAFESAFEDLISRIENIIEEKKKFIDKKLAGLGESDTFYQDIEEVLRSLEYVDDVWLRNTISEYSKPASDGKNFNDYLRKAVFLKKLLNQTTSKTDLLQLRSKILKVREYFLRHISSKPYTVYRGMKPDGLMALLKTSNPRIVCESLDEETIKKINDSQPIVFDDGLVSTSLNSGVSSGSVFRGKHRGNIFFTIEIPAGSKALVLDYEEISVVPQEEELLLAPGTKIKIMSMGPASKYHNGETREYYEINAKVVD